LVRTSTRLPNGTREVQVVITADVIDLTGDIKEEAVEDEEAVEEVRLPIKKTIMKQMESPIRRYTPIRMKVSEVRQSKSSKSSTKRRRHRRSAAEMLQDQTERYNSWHK
jgi:hypothetical protein